ncbi:hypothetical protein E1B28_002027 [Marasmius oreades]|uniref:Uncharacterized protein n=1 Tax=Marasmius oreades TaxID=181124 RepID=A0A9P7V4K5_9AGAR|nr:uncharacterized protein E1B28_002027 [Marasmius oreades]KAG7100255.1 hypothetical protein E1B28_002027 [Marasmius oreades]
MATDKELAQYQRPHIETKRQNDEHSFKDRVSTALAALDVVLNKGLETGTANLSGDQLQWGTPIYYSQLAEFDIINNSTTYGEHLRTLLLPAGLGFPNKWVHRSVSKSADNLILSAWEL